MGFIDSYKHLGKMCGEVLNDDRRVSAYIDEMLCPIIRLILHITFIAFSRFFSEEGFFFYRIIYDFFVPTPNKPLLNLEKFQELCYTI